MGISIGEYDAVELAVGLFLIAFGSILIYKGKGGSVKTKIGTFSTGFALIVLGLVIMFGKFDDFLDIFSSR